MTRTPDLLITNQLLYQLSYTSICENRLSPSKFCLLVYHVFARLKIPDLNYNRRPADYESAALPAELHQHLAAVHPTALIRNDLSSLRDVPSSFGTAAIIPYFSAVVNTVSCDRLQGIQAFCILRIVFLQEFMHFHTCHFVKIRFLFLVFSLLSQNSILCIRQSSRFFSLFLSFLSDSHGRLLLT